MAVNLHAQPTVRATRRCLPSPGASNNGARNRVRPSSLLNSLPEAGAHEQAAALASRPAAHATLDDPGGVVRLLDSLRRAGAHEQAAT